MKNEKIYFFFHNTSLSVPVNITVAVARSCFDLQNIPSRDSRLKKK